MNDKIMIDEKDNKITVSGEILTDIIYTAIKATVSKVLTSSNSANTQETQKEIEKNVADKLENIIEDYKLPTENINSKKRSKIFIDPNGIERNGIKEIPNVDDFYISLDNHLQFRDDLAIEEKIHLREATIQNELYNREIFKKSPHKFCKFKLVCLGTIEEEKFYFCDCCQIGYDCNYKHHPCNNNYLCHLLSVEQIFELLEYENKLYKIFDQFEIEAGEQSRSWFEEKVDERIKNRYLSGEQFSLFDLICKARDERDRKFPPQYQYQLIKKETSVGKNNGK